MSKKKAVHDLGMLAPAASYPLAQKLGLQFDKADPGGRIATGAVDEPKAKAAQDRSAPAKIEHAHGREAA